MSLQVRQKFGGNPMDQQSQPKIEAKCGHVMSNRKFKTIYLSRVKDLNFEFKF